MKYRSLYIVLFLLSGTSHIFACEPENDEARKQKRIKMYQRLFTKRLFIKGNEHRMSEFVEGFFKEARIINPTRTDKCEFYWHPTQMTPTLEDDKYVWMNPYNGGYDIYFKKVHEATIRQIVHEDMDVAAQAKVTLTIDPDGERDLILEITTVLDAKNTE